MSRRGPPARVDAHAPQARAVAPAPTPRSIHSAAMGPQSARRRGQCVPVRDARFCHDDLLLLGAAPRARAFPVIRCTRKAQVLNCSGLRRPRRADACSHPRPYPAPRRPSRVEQRCCVAALGGMTVGAHSAEPDTRKGWSCRLGGTALDPPRCVRRLAGPAPQATVAHKATVSPKGRGGRLCRPPRPFFCA